MTGSDLSALGRGSGIVKDRDVDDQVALVLKVSAMLSATEEHGN